MRLICNGLLSACYVELNRMQLLSLQ